MWVVDQNKELSLLSNTTHKTKDIACLKSQNRCSDRSHLPLAPIHSSQPATAGRQPLTQKISLLSFDRILCQFSPRAVARREGAACAARRGR